MFEQVCYIESLDTALTYWKDGEGFIEVIWWTWPIEFNGEVRVHGKPVYLTF